MVHSSPLASAKPARTGFLLGNVPSPIIAHEKAQPANFADPAQFQYRLLILLFPGSGDTCIVHEAMHAFGFPSHPHDADSVLNNVYRRRTLTPLDGHLIERTHDAVRAIAKDGQHHRHRGTDKRPRGLVRQF